MSKLKQYLESRPDIKELYVNKDGAWLRYARPGFELKTSEELLKRKAAATEQPSTEQPTAEYQHKTKKK